MAHGAGARAFTSAARRAIAACAFAAAVGLGSLAACAPGRALEEGAAPDRDSGWLASVGFPLRERDALLHLVRSEIAELRVDSITQLLVRAPRVQVRVRRDGRKEYLLHRDVDWAARPDANPDSACALDFFVNGNLMQMRVGDMVELQRDRMFEPYVLTAIEIFAAAEAPVGRPEGCGAVLLWIGRMRSREDPPFTAVLAGRILRQPGDSAIAGATVTAEPGGRTAVTNARGAFSFGAVPVAVYRVEADVPSWGEYRTEVLLRSNAVADVLIEVEAR